jgi:hypothetical protein
MDAGRGERKAIAQADLTQSHSNSTHKLREQQSTQKWQESE